MATGPKTTLTLKHPIATDDGVGGKNYTYTVPVDIEGVFSVLSDREAFMYGKLGEQANYKFTVDYALIPNISTVQIDDIFNLGTRSFKITGMIDPMEQHRWIIFLLQERKLG